jgi:hypothetical protein
MDALEQKLSSTLILQPKTSNIVDKLGDSPPKVPLRRLSVETPPRIAKIPEKQTKQIEVKKQEVVDNNPENVSIQAKMMTPQVIVKQQIAKLKVPSVSRGPMQFSVNEIVKKPEEAKKPEEIKKPMEIKKPEEAKNPEEAKKPVEVKKPVEKVKEPERLMLKDLKEAEWSTGKNVRAKIIAVLEHRVFTMCEESEKIDDYYNFMTQEIAKYCAGKPKVDYQPM